MSTLSTTNLKNPSSGSNNIVLAADGSTTITTLSSTTITGTTIQGTIKQGTPVASTSGTSIDFTGIPSWVKRVTVMFDGVSTNGTSQLLLRIGDSGGVETTGYQSAAGFSAVSQSFDFSTDGFLFEPTSSSTAASLRYGSVILTSLGSNTWIGHLAIYSTGASTEVSGAGAKTLSATLDRVRITTVNGTDTFDAGTINIMYEG